MNLTYVQANRMIPGPAGLAPSTVQYEGSDALKPGYLVCANSDYGTAAAVQADRWCRAEKPATGKLANFLGVIAGGRSAYPAEPGLRPINLPGSICQVWTDQNCVIDETLLTVKPGYVAGGVGQGLVFAKALQTVNRSSVPGLVLAKVFGVNRAHDAVATLSRGRTAVQMPTAAIWENFDLPTLRANPGLGSLLDVDFTNNVGAFSQASTALTRGDVLLETATEYMYTYPGAAGIGTMTLIGGTDNKVAAWRPPVPIIASGGAPWAIEARWNLNTVTDNALVGSFVGLMDGDYALTGDELVDNSGVLIDKNLIGFNVLAADGNALLFSYKDERQTAVAAAHAVPVASTYLTAGIYYNGTTIATYVNGVASANTVAAAVIAATGFPTAAVLVPVIAVKGGATATSGMVMDWIRVAQYAAVAG